MIRPSWAQVPEGGVLSDDVETAGAPKIYTIYNISMDETASSSSQASRTALKKAQRHALDKLFRKIIREEDYNKLPKLSDGQITELVSGLEVVNEKSSHIRYIADFIIHFSREKIYNFLAARQFPFAETLSQPASLLTLLDKNGATLLWEEQNDWRQAWQNYDTINNLVPVQVILPSLEHRLSISPWQAEQGNGEALKGFATKLGTAKLYVMSARVGNDLISQQRTLDLTIIENGVDQPVFTTSVAVKISADEEISAPEELSELYKQAIEKATYWLDNNWKEKVMIHFGVSSQIQVTVQFDQKTDWFDITKRLKGISLIRKMVVKSLTVEKALVEIEHSGDIEQIALALSQENLHLVDVERNAPGEASDIEILGEVIPSDIAWILTLKK